MAAECSYTQSRDGRCLNAVSATPENMSESERGTNSVSHAEHTG